MSTENAKPKNLDEAVAQLISEWDQKKWLYEVRRFKSEEDFIAASHHAAGRNIRNEWGLWWQEGLTENPSSEKLVEKPAIVHFFNELGIYHADDMSGIIFTSAYRKIMMHKIDLDAQVQHYKDFWKSKGYPDGIYKYK